MVKRPKDDGIHGQHDNSREKKASRIQIILARLQLLYNYYTVFALSFDFAFHVDTCFIHNRLWTQ